MTNATDVRSQSAPMETPCVQVCEIDNITGLCKGCGRTRGEIARWASITSEERRKIMSELPSRQKTRS
jgi:predicted Fe-S protein YdhL (DUF1289 family)